MPRPATRRRALAAALATVAVLSACTGNADEGAETQPTPVVAATAATSTADARLAAAVAALDDTSPTGEAAREAAFTGPALESAHAWAKTLPAKTKQQRADAALSTSGAKVLGISRVGDEPRQILVQTTLEKTKAAVLALLVAETPGADFKVAALTPMLAESRLDVLDPTSIGSQAIGDAAGLAATPKDVMQAFAGAVTFPEPKETSLLVEDPLTAQLRQSARAQDKAVSASGSFTQSHEPREVIGGLRLKNGDGAIVFANVVRTDSIALRRAAKLTPSKDFTRLTGIKRITTEASLTSNQIIAFVIPPTGAARIVAASDQLVAGTGR
ncbi:hypothetical protein OO014_12695 [Intrasporangium calvum]|uniref:Lipoprotein n=1 Tax=Intrasporangium calvum TaxID=53358 RepID=A0ABT5GJ48_9MICO|nr:hypothetical protein [Intrasporangium calvum]MDC5698118.1 hypothetical protein [Intrasporangium calvum]